MTEPVLPSADQDTDTARLIRLEGEVDNVSRYVARLDEGLRQHQARMDDALNHVSHTIDALSKEMVQGFRHIESQRTSDIQAATPSFTPIWLGIIGTMGVVITIMTVIGNLAMEPTRRDTMRNEDLARANAHVTSAIERRVALMEGFVPSLSDRVEKLRDWQVETAGNRWTRANQERFEERLDERLTSIEEHLRRED